MYLSACVDKGFSGRGFIDPPAFGWVESQYNKLLNDFNHAESQSRRSLLGNQEKGCTSMKCPAPLYTGA